MKRNIFRDIGIGADANNKLLHLALIFCTCIYVCICMLYFF